jgi:hypothetical protein
MAIRTAHIALVDLSKQIVASASCSEKRNGVELLYPIFMVELEDKEIALATIEARMRAKIVLDLAS